MLITYKREYSYVPDKVNNLSSVLYFLFLTIHNKLKNKNTEVFIDIYHRKDRLLTNTTQ